MVYYIGVVDGADDNWGVVLPDIDGCVGAGTSLAEAVESVTTALREVAEYRSSGSFELEPPSSFEAILASGEYGEHPQVVFIPLVVDKGRTVRANLTLDAGLLEAIDLAATRAGVSRSAFLADAARSKLLGTM